MWIGVLVLIGIVVTTLASVAVRSLHETAWHELEELCQQRRKGELFSKIFDLRDQLEFGVSILQVVAISLTACLAISWLAGDIAVLQQSWSLLIGNLILISMVLVACSTWVPQAVAQIGAEEFLFRSWRWWWLISAIFWPLFVGRNFVVAVFQRASGQDDEEDEEEAYEEEILTIVSEAENDGVLEPDRADMIEGVMDLDDNDVTKVMTPRSSIDMLDIATSWDQMFQFVVESGRTRIPVYQDKTDNIQGILYAKDLLRESMKSESKRRSLKKLLRQPILAPESTQLDEMLKKFLAGRMHMAVVQDEYGGLAGVVTIEDVLEEIVGEISDETDQLPTQMIRKIGKLEADVRGDVPIDLLNERMGLTLPEEEEFATIGGLIMNSLNEIPRPGHEIEIEGVQFEILEANRRSIRKVKVKLIDPE